ncbi:MAG: energy-coupling factor ABC transporter permease [Dethiobacter sp.]|jgi:cobalt/nickel transport system permease protein|nr:MAG: energy-coupling factor ABC transporter permease [Dethiobacter sp.]
MIPKCNVRKTFFLAGFIVIFWLLPKSASAMHIMEGFLPWNWALMWTLVTLPFLIWGFKSISKIFNEKPEYKMLLAMAGAFVFVISALKMPSVTGSCSHPTGVALGAVLFGPVAMTVISSIVLLFQALLLAHGGITTLGANIFSMGVAGPLLAFAVYKLGQKGGFPRWLSVFLAAFLANMGTYLVTSLQLALAFPMETGGVAASFVKFSSIFAITQIPLAASEGILTIIVFNLLFNYNRQELQGLLHFSEEVHSQ